jgi:protein TonB
MKSWAWIISVPISLGVHILGLVTVVWLVAGVSSPNVLFIDLNPPPVESQVDSPGGKSSANGQGAAQAAGPPSRSLASARSSASTRSLAPRKNLGVERPAPQTAQPVDPPPAAAIERRTAAERPSIAPTERPVADERPTSVPTERPTTPPAAVATPAASESIVPAPAPLTRAESQSFFSLAPSSTATDAGSTRSAPPGDRLGAPLGAAGSGAAGVGADGGTATSGTGRDTVAAVTGPGGSGDGDYGAYRNALRRLIQEVLRYPSAARRRGLSGTVELEIHVQPNGSVGKVAVVDSSAHPILDQAAVDAVRSLPRLPFPAGLQPRALRVRLPVVFELR